MMMIRVRDYGLGVRRSRITAVLSSQYSVGGVITRQMTSTHSRAAPLSWHHRARALVCASYCSAILLVFAASACRSSGAAVQPATDMAGRAPSTASAPVERAEIEALLRERCSGAS